MRRMYKKGFTLIELLAVIIILGVLMIIAIPSVTTYIQNSRKSAFVDSGLNYVKSGINTVNSGNKMRFYDTNTLYLIPAGHEDGKSCIAVESGGQSPFSDSWAYAYVGVTYDGKGYTYYYVAEDAAGQGVKFLSQTDLQNAGTDALYSSSVKSNSGYSALSKEYNATGDARTFVTYAKPNDGETLPAGVNNISDIKDAFITPASTELGGYEPSIKVTVSDDGIAIGGHPYTRVIVISSNDCKYTESITA